MTVHSNRKRLSLSVTGQLYRRLFGFFSAGEMILPLETAFQFNHWQTTNKCSAILRVRGDSANFCQVALLNQVHSKKHQKVKNSAISHLLQEHAKKRGWASSRSFKPYSMNLRETKMKVCSKASLSWSSYWQILTGKSIKCCFFRVVTWTWSFIKCTISAHEPSSKTRFTRIVTHQNWLSSRDWGRVKLSMCTNLRNHSHSSQCAMC